MSTRLENEARGLKIVNHLFIELGDVVAGLALSLDIDGVVLNTLSRRHD